MIYLIIFGELFVYNVIWYDFSVKKVGIGCDIMKLVLERIVYLVKGLREN